MLQLFLKNSGNLFRGIHNILYICTTMLISTKFFDFISLSYTPYGTTRNVFFAYSGFSVHYKGGFIFYSQEGYKLKSWCVSDRARGYVSSYGSKKIAIYGHKRQTRQCVGFDRPHNSSDWLLSTIITVSPIVYIYRASLSSISIHMRHSNFSSALNYRFYK